MSKRDNDLGKIRSALSAAFDAACADNRDQRLIDKLDAALSCAKSPGVYVLLITHRFGTDVTVHTTRRAARDDLHAYVQEEWERELGGTMPVDPDEAIARYFEDVEDEFYELVRRLVA